MWMRQQPCGGLDMWTPRRYLPAFFLLFSLPVLYAGTLQAGVSGAVPACRSLLENEGGPLHVRYPHDTGAEDTSYRCVLHRPGSRVMLDGYFISGGFVSGVTQPGADVTLDAKTVSVGKEGRFAMGFSPGSAGDFRLVATFPDGKAEYYILRPVTRDYPVERIDGLDSSKVSGFSERQLALIDEGRRKKADARRAVHPGSYWKDGFDWPVTGRISGVFGARRILNGVPGRPHSGVDIAVPRGTPVYAPAGGIITLAETDMFFEGGLVLLDHGYRLESAFMHLSQIHVAPGDRVQKGDPVGAAGSSGRATGPHLHWSLKWGDTLLDPALVAGPMPEMQEGAR